MGSHYDGCAHGRGTLPLVMISGLCLAVILMVQGCGGGGDGATAYTGPTGSLRGIVYAPDGVTPVAGALVYVPKGRADSGGTPPAGAVTWTTSGSDGSFVLDNVPAGTATVKIVKDQWAQSFDVNVAPEQTVQVTKTVTTLALAEGDPETPPDPPFPGGSGDALDPPPAPPSGMDPQNFDDMPPAPPDMGQGHRN